MVLIPEFFLYKTAFILFLNNPAVGPYNSLIALIDESIIF